MRGGISQDLSQPVVGREQQGPVRGGRRLLASGGAPVPARVDGDFGTGRRLVRDCGAAPMTANPAQRLTGSGLQVLVVTGGIALMTAALLADQAWWDRHFLPLYFFSRADFVLGERLARLAGA